MKKIIIFFAFLASLQAISQDLKRVEVKGKIIVESNDVMGITIFNKSVLQLASFRRYRLKRAQMFVFIKIDI